MLKHILLVEPDLDRLLGLKRVLDSLVDATAVSDFASARTVLREQRPDLLVANLRLHDYNGIHLALSVNGSPTRCVVYAKDHDLLLARQAQAHGALYLRLEQLPFALPALVRAVVPRHDRRNPAVVDRRLVCRHGRRSTDLPVLYAALRPPNVASAGPQ
jgi:DNA-binding response OmpR family regulator